MLVVNVERLFVFVGHWYVLAVVSDCSALFCSGNTGRRLFAAQSQICLLHDG